MAHASCHDSSSTLTDVDVCITGTGLTQCLIAAALANLGFKVLHMDSLSFYGRSEATLIWSCFLEFLNCLDVSNVSNQENSKPAFCLPRIFEQPYQCWYPFQTSAQHTQPIETHKATLMAKKIYVDLHPRLVFAQGVFTSMLMSAGVSHYIDFSSLDTFSVLIERPPFDGAVQNTLSQSTFRDCFPLPLNFEESFDSKTTIFNNDHLGLKEKRLIMKTLISLFLSSCPKMVENHSSQLITLSKNFVSPASVYHQRCHEIPCLESTSWNEVLKQLQFPDNLSWRLTYGFFLKPYGDQLEKTNPLLNWTTRDSIQRLRLIFSSLGRYSKGAYLIPLYGTGDFPQAFSRLCAVNAGISMLSVSIDKLVLNAHMDNVQAFESKTDIADDGSHPSPFITLSLDNSIVVKCKHLITSPHDLDRIGEIYDGQQQKTMFPSFLYTNPTSFEKYTPLRSVRLVALVTESVLPSSAMHSSAKFCVVVSKQCDPIHVFEMPNANQVISAPQYITVHMTQHLRESQDLHHSDTTPDPHRPQRPPCQCIFVACWTQVQQFYDIVYPQQNHSVVILPDPQCLSMPLDSAEINVASQVVRYILHNTKTDFKMNQETFRTNDFFLMKHASDET